MSTNLGTILVGLGYDLSALEKGAPEAFRLINSQTLGMSAEMKRASREGAESFRLIDEALGIHLSRPLTRILTQEFPSLAKGLQSILGVGVVGALGFAAVELFDKITSKVEHAVKAEEEFAAASKKTDEVFTSAIQSYEKAEKLRSLTGLDKKLFEVDYAAIEEGRKRIDELSEAITREAKASAEATKWTTELLAAIGEAGHVAFSSRSALGVADIAKQFEEFRQRFDQMSKLDALKGTHESAKLLADEVDKAKTALIAMTALRLTPFEQFKGAMSTIAPQLGFRPQIGFSQAEIDAQQKYIDNLKKISELLGLSSKDQTGKDDDARKAAALETQHEEIKELQGDLKGWNDAANEGWKSWMKINEEIEKASSTLGTLSDSSKRFQEASKIFFPAISQVGPPPGAPRLADQAELEKVTGDQNEAWNKAGEIVTNLETPLQKYSAQLAILKELETEGRISTAQFAQAQQQLQEQLAQSQQRMEKLLKEGGAAGGLQAFLMQMRGEGIKGTSGQFVFDTLNKGLQGFEDETVKALTGAKTNWASFFESLDQMALKFMLNGMISQLLKGFSSGGGGGGLFASLGSLFGLGGGGGSTGWGSVSSVLSDVGIMGFASGTDSAPGGLSWVGENGPELMNVPSGASITPTSALRGGHTFITHIDAKGAEIGVEQKIARAISAAAPQMIMRAVVESAELQRRTPR